MIKQFYERAKGNRWYHYFAILCRILLALAFIISGWVKISGERFASGLPVNNPMGHYLVLVDASNVIGSNFSAMRPSIHHGAYNADFVGSKHNVALKLPAENSLTHFLL